MFCKFKDGYLHYTQESLVHDRMFIGEGEVVAISVNTGCIVAIALWKDHAEGELLAFDLERKMRLWQNKGRFYDVKWVDQRTLAASDGKSICLLSENGEVLRSICKYSRTAYGPLDMQATTDGSALAFLRWEGDNRKLTFVDLDSLNVRKSKHSCHSYCFRSTAEAVFEHGGSIYLLDTRADKKSLLIKSTKKLLEKNSSATDDALRRIKMTLADATCHLDQLAFPMRVAERMYFSSFVCGSNSKIVSLLSVDEHLRDLQVHFHESQGLVRGIHVTERGALMGIRLWPNTLLEETVLPGWYFSRNGGSHFIEDADLVRAE